MRDLREERITQLYEDALEAMKKYSSHEEYLSAEPEVHKPITLSHLASFVKVLRHQINEYDCCIDGAEMAKVGTEILYWCRSISQYDCVEEDEDEH